MYIERSACVFVVYRGFRTTIHCCLL